MTTAEPAREALRPIAPWLQLCPPETTEIDIRSGLPAADRVSAEHPIVLLDQRPFSRRRLRRVARELGVLVEREFVVLPSVGRPMVIMDDTKEAVRHFWNAVATVPPGLALTALPASALLGLARLAPWRWTGAVAPGRVVIGRRP